MYRYTPNNFACFVFFLVLSATTLQHIDHLQVGLQSDLNGIFPGIRISLKFIITSITLPESTVSYLLMQTDT